MTTAEYNGLQKLILGVRDELKDEMNRRFDEVHERFDEARVVANETLNAIGEDHTQYERRLTALEAKAA